MHSCDETSYGGCRFEHAFSNADSDMVLKDVLMFDVLPISLGVNAPRRDV